MDNFENNAPLQQEDAFPVRELFFRCLSKWPWFVASLGICLLAGLYKIIKTEPVYHTSAEVQIKSDSKGRSISDQNDFSNMGMFTMRSNVNNELRAFQSPDLMSEVVERLNLDVNYYVIGRKRQYAYYGTALPIIAKFIEPSKSGTSFVVQLQTDSTTVRLKDFTSGSEKLKALLTASPEELKSATLCDELTFEPLTDASAYVKEWDINGEQASVGVARI
jgi:uncharacterized protein involved in exopolysaccharide biosynthesis